MSCEDIPSLLDLQKAKLNADDFGRLMGTGTGVSTNEVTGQVRPTYNAVMANLGYTRIGTFATGGTLTTCRQTLLWDIADGGDGQEYGWSGSFPLTGKVVPSGSTPLTTGGIAIGAWMSRFDPALHTQVFESLRRSYAEAGYNLVSGSFEVGGALVNANDVLIQERTGKAFSGPAGAVAAGTNPASGGFVDRSDMLLSSRLTEGPLVEPIAYGRSMGVRLLPSTSEFAAAGYQHDGTLIDAMFGARKRGGVINSDIELSVSGPDTFSGTNTTTNTIIEGTADISGLRRKQVTRPWRGTYTPVNTINPEVHLARMMETTNPVVVLFGDSISTQGPNTSSGIQSMETLIRAKFIKDNPHKNIKWYNRAIGGQTFVGANGIPSNLDYFNPSWYTDHNRGWLQYVQDLQPDVVIIAFGMNDGGSINQTAFFSLMAKIKAWGKVPDILFVTTPVPSRASVTPFTQYSVHAGQEGRDVAAGFVRSYAGMFGHGVIDVNRACVAMRDGYDVISNPLTHYETVTAPFYRATVPCTDFSFTATIDCTLWDTSEKVVSCRIGPHTQDLLFLTMGTNRELSLGGYSPGFGNYRTTPTGYTLPTAGSVTIDIGVYGNVAKLIKWTAANLEDRVELATIPVMRLGGEFLPWLTFGQNQDSGPFTSIKFNRGYKFPKYRQTITDTELWGPSDNSSGTKAGYGGNGINHYSGIGLDLVVAPVVDSLNLSAPVDTNGVSNGGQWFKYSNGLAVFRCKKRITVSITQTSGALFNSGYLVFSDFPKIFASDGAGGYKFSGSIMIQTGGSTQLWVASAGAGTGSINDAIYYSILCPTSVPSANIDINVTMVGTWR